MINKNKLPYGFTTDSDDNIIINEPEANAVRIIFSEYLGGKSLGGVCEVLEQAGIPSTTGTAKWGRSVVNNILTKGCYMKAIVSEEDFFEAQFERERRSNINQDTGKRTTGRYNSQNVLAGLLVCTECGSNYRRITTRSGNVVWRCANRVEHGSEICGNSPTVSEAKAIAFICNAFNVSEFDPHTVRDSINAIQINKDGGMTAKLNQTQSMEFLW